MIAVSRPDLSVILVNWNALALTSRALTSLRENTAGIEYEVIVIDNASTKDASVSTIPDRFPWVTFISNEQNYGFSKATNQGLKRATGRHLLLLNTDTFQIDNVLGKSVRYMDAHPDVGALGVLHLNDDHSFQPSFSPFPVPWRETLSVLGLLSTAEPRLVTTVPLEQDVDWLCGSFLLIRRDCLDEVGYLDEHFFIYDEDIDWCLRAWKSHWRVRFWSGVSIIHLGAASRRFMVDKTFTHFRSHLSYIRKNHSLGSAAFYYVAMNLRLAAATLFQAIRYIAGRATLNDLRDRYKRQLWFLFLRSSRIGC